MNKLKYLFILLGLSLLILSGFSKTQASEELSDWIIRDFKSEITVNKDSSLDITEKITADCGDLPDKHGIYRIIPYVSYGRNSERFKTPIQLESITNEKGARYKYEVINNRADHTITWKIGDANKEVTGLNNYIIKYHVENTIRTNNPQFDELYWNLNGNFWQIDTEKYEADIVFPSDFPVEPRETNLYAGEYGKNISGLANSIWSQNTLTVKSTRALSAHEGITISVTAPKNYFTPYVPTFWEKYFIYIYILIPVSVLVCCLYLWSKYGRDPKINPTIAPEFEVPEGLNPIDMGLVVTDGKLKNNFLTAGIIYLAVNKFIKITVSKKSGLLSSADYTIEKIKEASPELPDSLKNLMESLFETDANSVQLSTLKNQFYTNIPSIEKSSLNYLESKNWVAGSSRNWMAGFVTFGIIAIFGSFVLFAYDTSLAIVCIAAAIIIFVFSPLMKHRTREGALLLNRIKGFELYMKKAEVYRQQWLEKQNYFDTFLPYAIVFGIAKEWMKKMKEIYGEKYFSTYHPIWYAGYAGSFDFNDFSNSIDSMSHSMASTLSSSPSSSGSGGGGFSGGGGGGGGGGGW